MYPAPKKEMYITGPLSKSEYLHPKLFLTHHQIDYQPNIIHRKKTWIGKLYTLSILTKPIGSVRLIYPTCSHHKFKDWEMFILPHRLSRSHVSLMHQHGETSLNGRSHYLIHTPLLLLKSIITMSAIKILILNISYQTWLNLK